MEAITKKVLESKDDAVILARKCGINLSSLKDNDLVKNLQYVVTDAITNDQEFCEDSLLIDDEVNNEISPSISQRDIVSIQEDLTQIKLRKNLDTSGIPTYVRDIGSETPGESTSIKTYSLQKTNKGTPVRSPFVKYRDAYIRKTTALYLLQENFQVSKDRLLRVRAEQPTHIFGSSSLNKKCDNRAVKCGDLCVFKRVDDNSKCLLRRVIQFSYMQGNKKERQYSSDYVDLTKDSHQNIGVFANWFNGTNVNVPDIEEKDIVNFIPLNLVFTPGYLSLQNYVATIDDSSLVFHADYSFSIPVSVLELVLPQWKVHLTFDL